MMNPKTILAHQKTFQPHMRIRQEHLYGDRDLEALRNCAIAHQSVGACLLKQVLLQSGSLPGKPD
eukprot:6333912-Prorocentrum_lima.AAC.1